MIVERRYRVTSKACTVCKVDGIPIVDFIWPEEDRPEVEHDVCCRCQKAINDAAAKQHIRKHVAFITKKCVGCKIEMPIAGNFNKDKSRKDGFQPRCKPCQHAYQEHYMADKKDVRKRYQSRARINRLLKEGKITPEKANEMMMNTIPVVE